MDYVWDWTKAKTNLVKHGVDFADAVTALEDDFAITIPDPDVRDEQRFVSIGLAATGRILVTVFAQIGSAIRIISSRKASRRERLRYEND